MTRSASSTWDIVGARTWIGSFLRTVTADPTAIAVQDESGAQLSREELRARAAQVAVRLAEGFDVRHGDRVGLLLENGIDYAPVVVALAGLGAVASPISTKLTPGEIDAQVRSTGLKLLVVAQDHDPIADVPTVATGTLSADMPGNISSAVELLENGAAALASEDHSTIICTSGSTAAPKPIVLSHGNVMFAVSSSWSYYAIGDGDSGLSVFPWCHSNGHINQLVAWLALGVRIIAADRFTASGFPSQLERLQPTIAPLNGTHIKMILAKLPADVTAVDSPLRIVPTALELDAASAGRFVSIFSARLRKVWYQTETIAPGTVCDLNPARTTVNDNPLGFAGLAHELRLVDDAGASPPAGEVGEIHVRALTRHAIAVGRIDPDTHDLVPYDRTAWWPTGDLAIADPDGFLFYAGRTKEMVKRAGHNVALPEVIDVIRSHTAVVEATAIGVPDPMREEKIVAVVVLGHAASSEDIRAWCTGRLAEYKVPSEVLVMPAIPRTEIGKIDTKRIRQEYETTQQAAAR
jgi:crotonobetaine/carnitine-CoA ligase